MGNSSPKEATVAQKQEENRKLQLSRAQSQLSKPITILLIGEENSGKDTICLQLLKKASEEAKTTSPEQQQQQQEVKPSHSPVLYHLCVNNPNKFFAALNNNNNNNNGNASENLRFNLVTLPGNEKQRNEFWNEKTFRKVAGAECDLKDDEAFFADGLFFVIDSSDKEKVARASQVLHEILHQKHLEKCPIVIFANKQDLPTAMKAQEVENHMKLIRVPGGRMWCVVGCAATKSSDLLYDGLNWLLENRPERS